MSGGFCPACGARATEGARFCAACGKPLPQAGAPPAASGDAERPARAPSPAATAAETEVYAFKPYVVRTAFELLVCIVTLGIAWVVWWALRFSTSYRVTTQRIEVRTGLLTRRRSHLDLFRVEDLEIEEPFFLRLRGAGNLRIWSMDKDDPELVLAAVRDVQEVFEKLRELTRAERARHQVRVIEGM